MARDEEGKVIFDEDEQAKVDEIIADRLKRAKAEKPSDYDDLKELETVLEVFGYSGTPAEKAKALKEYVNSTTQTEKEAIETVAEIGEIPDEAVLKALAKKFGTTPEKIEKSIKKSIEADEKEEKIKSDTEKWNEQVKEFEESFSDVSVDELTNDAKFVKFAQKRLGTLAEIYGEYVEFVGEAEVKALQRIKNSEERSTGGGAANNQGTYGLSKEQLDDLKAWNDNNPHLKMSAKEFKERHNR